MKKFLATVLSVILIATISSMFVSAIENDPEGFQFDILEVDKAIQPEKGLILTSAQALADSKTGWSIVIHCEKVEENVYKVVEAPATPTGTVMSFTFKEGDIVIAIHSATSKVEDAATYPNVTQKLAALNVTSGMYFKLVGIDLTAKTATNGKAICSSAKPTADVVSDTSKPAESSAAASSAADTSKATSSAVSAGTSSAINTNSKVDSKTISSMDTNSTDNSGLNTTTIILIAVAAVAVIAVIIVVATKKKK